MKCAAPDAHARRTARALAVTIALVAAAPGGCGVDRAALRVSDCAAPTMHGVSKPAFHGGAQRLGWNANESVLTPALVGGTAFGPVWQSPAFDTLDIDGVTYAGRMYASPLYLDDVDVKGGAYDGVRASVIFAATSNGFVYALNAFGTSCGIGELRSGDVFGRRAWEERRSCRFSTAVCRSRRSRASRSACCRRR